MEQQTYGNKMRGAKEESAFGSIIYLMYQKKMAVGDLGQEKLNVTEILMSECP